jgi:drug/metabolite transporter (DMT)-like permease
MSHYLLIALAMVAFAGNSILCRLALGEQTIDAASFTALRLLSGAVMLALILAQRKHGFSLNKINPLSTSMLYLYAVCFSFSYINLSVATGALLLFGAVQITMIGFALLKGERPGATAWVGIVTAFAGLIYLLLPGVSTPPLFSAMLMIIAGIAWGIYTLRGKGAKQPLVETGWNFIGTIPLALLTLLLFQDSIHLTTDGVILACVSGALASALGYVIWYSVLPHITPTNAATVQLSVPVIAAFGGLALVGEAISLRLVVASLLVLGGIYMTIHSAAKTR